MEFILILWIGGNNEVPTPVATYPTEQSCKVAGEVFAKAALPYWSRGKYACIPAPQGATN